MYVDVLVKIHFPSTFSWRFEPPEPPIKFHKFTRDGTVGINVNRSVANCVMFIFSVYVFTYPLTEGVMVKAEVVILEASANTYDLSARRI